MAQQKQEKIEFHNTPSFYLEYVKNWLVHKKNEKSNPAEIAIIEDIKKLVEIAVDVLTPIPAEPENKKTN